MKFGPLPTPPQLFRQFERGDITREELHSFMALHARDLIEDMGEDRKNPVAAYLERLRNQAAVRKLARKNGKALVREVLIALGEIEGFPPSHLLWNANHSDMPLHCFFRSRVEPVFRIVKMDVAPMKIQLKIEYGAHSFKSTTRETIILQRDAMLQLSLAERIGE